MCKKTLGIDAFSKASGRKDGLQSRCKKCSTEVKRAWIQENRDKVAVNQLWSKYRIRPDQYNKLLTKQNNSCGICLEKFRSTPHVDHDHSCCQGAYTCGNCIRGLLCARCNKALGSYESIMKFSNLRVYLSK